MDDLKPNNNRKNGNKSRLNFSYKSSLSDNPVSVKNLCKGDPIISAGNRAATGYAGVENTMHVDRMNRFNSPKGSGIAAEQANHLGDKIRGRNAKILGDNNAKNGADRIVDGQLIQTKYCKTAVESVNAGFSKGKYRYLDANGNPMQLEVPADQYEKAVERMAEKIKQGEVPNTTDPNDARKIIRKGHVTYKQARNIAKAGNIDSLMFDAIHGIVIAASAGSISTIVSFAQARWQGKSVQKSIDMAVYNGIQSGGIAFASSILTAQLTRTSLNKVLISPMNYLVQLLPSKLRQTMVNVMRKNAPIYGAAASKNLAKLLRGNVIATISTTLVLSAPDIYRFASGRISGKQLFKNMMVRTSETFVVAVTFTVTLPGLNLIVSSAADELARKGTKQLLDSFIEDDAVRMVEIINQTLVPLAEEYLLSEEELLIVINGLNIVLGENVLLAMFASSDEYQYANDLLITIIEDTVKWRTHITTPDTDALVDSVVRVVESTLNGEDLFEYLVSDSEDMAAISNELGAELPEDVAMKAEYVTKQRNILLAQNEVKLKGMADSEREFATEYNKLSEQIEEEKQEFYRLIKEQNHE